MSKKRVLLVDDEKSLTGLLKLNLEETGQYEVRVENWPEDALKAAREFQLIECFCYEDQALGPRETRELPVYFALSPRTPADVNELLLSYTLFPRDPTKTLPVPAKDAN